MQAIGDPALLQIVGRHLYLHAVTRKDAHAMDPHASGKSTEELVIFRLVGDDPNAEGGIGETLFHNADELYDIFGHTEGKTLGKAAIS